MKIFPVADRTMFMEVREKGVRYRASMRAYIGNYIIAAGVVIFAILTISKFGIRFDLHPTNAIDVMGTLVYAAFGAVLAWLLGEPFIEGSRKHYVVAHGEVVKVEGILSKRRHAIPYQSVSEIKVTKGIFGRIFNYGSVEIGGAHGESSFSMKHVSNPQEAQRIIQHRVSSMRGGSRRSAPRNEDKEEESLE